MTELHVIEDASEYPQGDVAPMESWLLEDFSDIVPASE